MKTDAIPTLFKERYDFMAKTNFSRQREAIKDYLASTTSHPTADTIYENIKKIYPNISLGTVYRNLNLLVEQGEVLKLSCDDNRDHFDATTTPHHHFFCKCCHQVSDLPLPAFLRNLLLIVPVFQEKLRLALHIL